MYGKMILPTDGSELAHVGIEEGLKAAKKFDIPAVAIYVLSPTSYSHSYIGYDMGDIDVGAHEAIRKGLKKQGEKVLKEIEKDADEIGVKLKTKIVEGTPYKEICRLAKKDDIIYISSHGRSGISSLFLGSTTDRVIKHTKATVSVVKAKNDER
ncbi:MAG: universal stress protein [Candidatus Saliniplasma sp.]